MKINWPLVSVIMCVYNTPQEFLIEAVNSIINQTYSNLELIIVDDHSCDDLYSNSLFTNSKIRILRNSENHGPSYSRNKAIDVSKGKYIAIMDSDDISLPTRIEKQVKYMEQNDSVVACGTWFKFIGNKNHEVKRVIDDNEYYRCCLFFDNEPTLLNSSVMIRKEVLEKNAIRYDEHLFYGEDYKMWCQLSKVGIITNYKEVLVYYRVHENQMTQSNKYREHNKSHKIGEGLLNEIGAKLNHQEKELFFEFLGAKKYTPIKYTQLLKRLVLANKESKIYEQDRFEKRINEQWVKVVQNIKNPFVLFIFLINQKGNRKDIFRIKVKQIFRKHQ